MISEINTNKRYKDFKVIFECRAGSHLYGTNTEFSDVDTRGVFIPTKEYFFGFVHKIEQVEDNKTDTVHYDIRKFFHLCLQCNPNIVELLFVPENQRIISTWEWDEIINNKEVFLSKKARYTFSGYAVSQLHRIKQHRNWLLHPPKRQPQRSDFGLPEDKALVTKEQLNTFNELVEKYSWNAIEDLHMDVNTMAALQREKAFLNKNKEWNSYKNWEKNRNPERAVLEAEYGFDTKHGSHLYRLITEGKELLLTGHITFPRPDADVILDIKNGKYSYDELMDFIGDIDEIFDKYYEESILPHKPMAETADKLCVKLVEDYLKCLPGI